MLASRFALHRLNASLEQEASRLMVRIDQQSRIFAGGLVSALVQVNNACFLHSWVLIRHVCVVGWVVLLNEFIHVVGVVQLVYWAAISVVSECLVHGVGFFYSHLCVKIRERIRGCLFHIFTVFLNNSILIFTLIELTEH